MLLLPFADRVAELAIGLLVRQGLHELIAPHSDVAMDPPQWQHDAMVPERAIPRDRMVVVGIDERAVDVEYRDGHGSSARRAPRTGHAGLPH